MYIPEVGIRAGLEFSAEHVYWFDPENDEAHPSLTLYMSRD